MEVQQLLSPQEWAEQTFGGVQLGHVARGRRAIVIAAAMAREPAGSVPAQQQSDAGTKAVYRFCENAQVSYEALMQPHVDATREQSRQVPRVLLMQDTTELDYQHHPTTTGLGPIGNGTHQGFLLQSVLALDAATEAVLGLAHQEPFLRQPVPKGETARQQQERPRESQVWERAVQSIGTPPAGVQWIHVGDRYSDMFAFLSLCGQMQTQFVVRASQDRRIDLLVEPAGQAVKRYPHRKTADLQEPPVHLVATVESWPQQAEHTMLLPAEHKRPARTARLALSYGRVRLLAPSNQEHIRPPLSIWVVRVWELEPPEGVTPVEWVLLTSVPTTSIEEAWERVGWYRLRWTVEDYHQGLKTGCHIEQRQLQSYEGLRRLLGFIAPLAVRLLQLRWHARQNPEQPAVQVLPRLLVHLVALKTGGSVSEMTSEQCWKKIAQLGGYLGRKGDGPPGWKTLWHGWFHLQDFWEGARLATQLSLDD